MPTLNLKPTHRPVRAYYEEINTLANLDFYDEGAVSPAFAALLRHCSTQYHWTLVEKYGMSRGGRNLFVDGALVDSFKLPHGYWEAKDTKDDLEREIQKKFDQGYPKDNILFQAPHRAVIWRDGREYFQADLSQPEHLVETLKIFFEYQPPQYEEWGKAVNEFKGKLPELARALKELIEREHHTNPRFIQAFEDFAQLCRQALNPNLSDAAVEEMIIQHILTERIFRKVFNNPDFAERNIIAYEIEKVIRALTSQSFSREEFLRKLDRFYLAIEDTAASIEDYNQKQGFLNTVYERFFQGFSVKLADTHGIVYTPAPIVDFMVRSVDELLRREFGRSLADDGVHVLDPFVGTGNFILRVMREIPGVRLEPKYARELHCNEVMLLPYYIASMNIEHKYYERTGTYKAFEGICLVDTFELAEAKTARFLFVEENLQRIELQKKTPIFVIIGNPPYNAGQVNENDNNKNRKYQVMDRRVSETYAKASQATLVRKYSDPYIKAIRYATDRIGAEGIVAFVTNHSFVHKSSFDGVRKHLEDDFNLVYILDLGGNVRDNPKLSGTTHNVFGIQPGVSINIFIKKSSQKEKAKIFYARTDEWWRKEEKYQFLDSKRSIAGIAYQELIPDSKYTWLTEGLQKEFEDLVPLGTKSGKRAREAQADTIFQTYSLGVSTNRDVVVYGFDKNKIIKRVIKFINDFNAEVFRYKQIVIKCMKEFKDPPDVDDFVDYNKIQWSDTLKRHLAQGSSPEFIKDNIRSSVYRPFTNNFLYYDSILNDRPALFQKILPNKVSESENHLICVNQSGERPFTCLISNKIPNLVFCGGFGSATQCFPFYTYDEDGANRRENLTDWALAQYRSHYRDEAIGKWDIFHYVYALLHHPGYRQKYAANLRRELPRIPFAPEFHDFAAAGARLAGLHVNYEQQQEYPLNQVEKPGARLDWRVERLKLSPDKTRLAYNNFLTLEGIPPQVFDYKLGNRSALEWVIDQYRVSTDRRSGITNDPNRPDDPQYIVRLLGRVITVSLETLKIIQSLPDLE